MLTIKTVKYQYACTSTNISMVFFQRVESIDMTARKHKQDIAFICLIKQCT